MTDHKLDLKPGHAKSIRRGKAGQSFTNDGILYIADGDTVSVPAIATTPPPDPDPNPDPGPVPSGKFILGVDPASLPKTGRVASLAKQSAQLDYANNGDASGHAILQAKAWMGDKAGVLAMIRGAANRDLSVHSLRASRNLGAYAIALNIVGAHEEDAWLKEARDHAYTADGGFGSIVYPGGGSAKANNHGSAADQSVAAVDLHLGDKAHLESKLIPVFTERLSGAQKLKLNFGDTSFQADPSKPTVVGRVSDSKQGISLDGILAEEQRRQGSFPNLNDGNYNFGASGQMLLTCWLLKCAGYPADTWADAAVKRIFVRFQKEGWKPSGDDSWQGHLVKKLFGAGVGTPLAIGDGKTVGLTDYWAA
jgi:hypothetical protein